MPLAASIEFPQGDVRALWAQIDRAQRELGRSLGASVKTAANMVARSIGASARRSDKYRDFRPVVGSQTTRGRQEYEVYRPYYARKTRRFFAWNDQEAKESRYVKIGRRGLAKAIWAAIARGIGGSHLAGSVGFSVAGLAKKYGYAEARLSGEDPYVKLTNESYYAEAALSGGPQDVTTAIARASRAMEKTITNQLVKKMGLA
jgi:hypothetical protein